MTNYNINYILIYKSSELNIFTNEKLISGVILLHEKFLQSDWLRAVVFQLNLKYLHVKITTFCG